MKLGRSSRFALGIGIFVIVFASLGFTRYQQGGEQGLLDDQLTVAEKRLNNLQIKDLLSRQEELQKQLDESTAELNAARKALAEPNDSISVIDEFFMIAQSCAVEVKGISCSGVSKGKLEGIDCTRTGISASLTGNAINLIHFISRLNDDFVTGKVESAQVSIPEQLDQADCSASISMVVYAYEGD